MTLIQVNQNGGQDEDSVYIRGEDEIKQSRGRRQYRGQGGYDNKNGRPAAILVSPDEFEGWKETVAIKSDKDLMKEIKSGLKDLKKKGHGLYTLDELFK